MFFRRSRELEILPPALPSQEIWTNGFSTASDGDSKLDESTIQAVEASLREACTLNNEEARALLGKLEYQKENFDAALKIFEGIQVSTIFNRVKFLSATKVRHRRSRSRTEVSREITVSAAGLLLDAVYLKVNALDKTSRLKDAAQECLELLDSFDLAFPQGLPDALKLSKIQEVLNKILEFLPGVLTRERMYVDAVAAYRRAILSFWSPNQASERLRALQLSLALLLLYGGVEAPPCPTDQYAGGFVPSNDLEEAVLLLLTIIRTTMHPDNDAKSAWDPSVVEHLCYALSICGHHATLAQLFESVLPGIYKRTDRWHTLGLCYHAMGEKDTALQLMRKVLNNVETPDDVASLLMAATICAQTPDHTAEGVTYAERALDHATGAFGYMKGRAWHILGTSQSKQARGLVSSAERTRLHKRALSSLQEASKLESLDPDVELDKGLEYAEQGNLVAALASAKAVLELSSGALVRGWRFLALVLSGQQRNAEAEMVLDAGMKEAGAADKTDLLFTKAKLQASAGNALAALETCKSLIGLSGSQRRMPEVWLEMAAIYTSLSQWGDAVSCLDTAKSLGTKQDAAIWYAYGELYVAQDNLTEARDAFNTALTLDPSHVESKVRLGSIFASSGGRWLAVARSYLNDAVRSQPKNASAWYQLGIVHESENRLLEAAECFQAAYILEQSSPVERFATLAD